MNLLLPLASPPLALSCQVNWLLAAIAPVPSLLSQILSTMGLARREKVAGEEDGKGFVGHSLVPSFGFSLGFDIPLAVFGGSTYCGMGTGRGTGRGIGREGRDRGLSLSIDDKINERISAKISASEMESDRHNPAGEAFFVSLNLNQNLKQSNGGYRRKPKVPQ